MPGFTDAKENQVLDANFSDSDKIAFSENGSTETAKLAKMPVVDWANAANGQKSNAGVLQTPACTGTGTITHFRVVDASDVAITDWIALNAARDLQAIGDKLEFAVGSIVLTLE